MLHRHLFRTSAKIGVGRNRAQLAASIIHKFGYIDPVPILSAHTSAVDSQVGIVILDDGMQVSEINFFIQTYSSLIS